jgi:TM2 domain-containing membrane protein YozV
MKDENIDWKLFFILFFVGYLGVDKFYVLKGPGWKLFLYKLLASCIGIGFLWNIIDMIMCLVRLYRANPLDYLGLIEDRNK